MGKRALMRVLFIMSVLFFLSTVINGAIPATERAALIALYNSTNGDNWTNNNGWKTPPLDSEGFAMPGTEGDWDCVQVKDDHVIYLSCDSNNLTGTIPAELGNLTYLRGLFSRSNGLTGSIPKEIGNLTNLETLDLRWNNLSGSIPKELGTLNNLRNLWLASNSLSGSIPEQLWDLTKLESLWLQSNNFEGNLPEQIGNLINLEWIDLSGNSLSGEIPEEFFNLTKLVIIRFAWNTLEVASLKEFTNFQELSVLDLTNCKSSENIPKEFGNFKKLRELDLGRNELTGSIPKELGNLSQLEILFLSHNNLSGTIPNEIGQLTNLKTLGLGDNNLDGTIPNSVENLAKLEYLRFSANKLFGSIPSALMNLTNLKTLGIVDNCFYTNDPDLKSWLDTIAPGWKSSQNECSAATLYTLYVNSSPKTGIDITVSPNDKNNRGNGSTEFTRTYFSETDVTLTAPPSFSGKNFLKWLINGSRISDRTIFITMNRNHIVQAVYQPDTYSLTVQSSPDSGASIAVSPNDNNGSSIGSTEFIRTYDSGTIITLTAATSYNGKNFLKWFIDGQEQSNQTINVTMNQNHTVQAVYQSNTYTLTVQSSPSTGIGITVSPYDNNGNGDGNTNFERTYDSGTNVTLTALSSANGSNFIKWGVNGQDFSNTTIQVTMEGGQTVVAYYETSTPPEISVNRRSLKLAYIINSSKKPKGRFIISNTSGGNLNWTMNTDMTRLSFNPVSGGNYEEVEVTMDPTGLMPGKFRGVAYITDPLVSNSPVEIEIKLWVKKEAKHPLGEFATPEDNANVSSSIPVTGWALGDTGIESVKIYREEGSGLVYIGGANFVEGARSDIEEKYPDYPMNYKAGWGYMLLTHFLPNGGNGTFKLHAIAVDKEGLTTDLGTKTIIVDNANAVKPFGAIDTPTQGGTASGSQFINWGWVLTPQPNSIPIDGSTIDVWVNGVKLGHPAYNFYREDIANLFPAYANSGGAIGYYYLDTTAYANGVHTIQWTARDSAGNSDGIGSRYFTVENTGGASRTAQSTKTGFNHSPGIFEGDIPAVPLNLFEPVGLAKGLKDNAAIQPVYPGEEGTITIRIKELERIAVYFFTRQCRPASPLPIGSRFNSRHGIFYWQPGPGFYGNYQFDFIKQKGQYRERVHIKIEIAPLDH